MLWCKKFWGFPENRRNAVDLDCYEYLSSCTWHVVLDVPVPVPATSGYCHHTYLSCQSFRRSPEQNVDQAKTSATTWYLNLRYNGKSSAWLLEIFQIEVVRQLFLKWDMNCLIFKVTSCKARKWLRLAPIAIKWALGFLNIVTWDIQNQLWWSSFFLPTSKIFK